MITINKLTNFDVTIACPPSKAHTLRALLIGSLAEGKSIINNPLLAEDQLNMISCLRRLGVKIDIQKDKIIVEGANGVFSPTADVLNVGDSGLTMNFLAAAACLSRKKIAITGSKRLNERPIGEVVSGLRQLGCKITFLEKDGFPPIKIEMQGIEGGNAKIHGQKTSQYFSSIILSAPYAKKEVKLVCLDQMNEKPYIDISIEMAEKFGGKVENKDYEEFTIANKKYAGKDMTIEGDFSSAAFFFLAAAICSSKVAVSGLNPETKQGDKLFVDLIKKMGCEVRIEKDKVQVKGGNLKAIDEDMSNVPDLVPPISIAAAFAEGTSKFRNISHLADKESNRINAILEGLKKMGVSAKYEKDSLIIEGSEKIHGANINPHNDHRIAMSFGIAGLAVGNQIIEDEKCVAKSFPDFWDKLAVFCK